MTANLKIGPCPKCGNTTFITTAHLTPPTIEIVGFLGGGGKAYHHAAYKAASYAISHQQLRV